MRLPVLSSLLVVAWCLPSGIPPVSAQSLDEQVKASTPLSPKPGQQVVAGRTVKAEVCTTADTTFFGTSTSGMFKSIEAVGDRLLIAREDGAVAAFTIGKGAGCALTPDASFGDGGVLKLKDKIEWLSSDTTGRVYASHGIFRIYGIKDGKEQFSCETSGFVQAEPGGGWGLAYRANSTVKLVEFGKFNCKSVKPWVLQDLGSDDKRQGIFTNVNSTAVVGDTIFVGGVLAKSENPKTPRVVVAYDRAGKEKFRFGNTDAPFAEDRFGWVHAISACADGVCALDGNSKRLTLWGLDGEFYGSVALDKLFDLKSPWINDFAVSAGGHVYVAAAQTRAGSKVVEGLIYRISGF